MNNLDSTLIDLLSRHKDWKISYRCGVDGILNIKIVDDSTNQVAEYTESIHCIQNANFSIISTHLIRMERELESLTL